ncbi:sugar transferase [Algoriphagus aestuariicola]|uniref:Sugar transferase n=1 Tax=Algoriphagus aestuariicola TaxID=1852016 RepID=A0ABS3BS99_9BACT|nr:sugar transferase [Algoriphagus aestuariicola]MBN7801952.1 sugar transferase [Algoriphagus aestuariicola]
MRTNQHQDYVLQEYGRESPLPTFVAMYRVSTDTVREVIFEGIEFTTRFIKRTFDIAFSSVVMLLGLPVFLTVMLITKLSSKGPVFYKQERIGRNGIPFYIYKFRSMVVDSEVNGPQLAKDDDPRITRWGKIMRKTHLDELPQFWNVLKGEMSIVGPRPERAHFIRQIAERAPAYWQLLAIKPGITSIGQVDYGYAENVDQMVERMSLDLRYLSDVNIFTDLEIILKTVGTMVGAKGK